MDFLGGISYVAFCAQERNSFFLVNNAQVFSQQLNALHTQLSVCDSGRGDRNFSVITHADKMQRLWR